MFLSVIIPVYNGEKYLEQCVMSVLEQPYRDIEVICINDGSSDKSASILQTLSEKDDRMRVLTQANQGVASARNKGILNARGIYLAFLDQDDCYSKNVLSASIVEQVEEKPHDLVSFSYYESDQQMKRGRLCSRDAGDRAELATYAWEHYRHHSSYFYRSEFVRKNNFLVDPYRNEDERFRMQCVYSASMAKYLAQPLFVYRNNPLSVTHQQKKVSTVLYSCLEGFSLLAQQTKHLMVADYCKDTILHLLLELAIELAKEGESPQRIAHELDAYGVQALFNRGSWMSDSDRREWDMYFNSMSDFVIRHRRKARIRNCARILLAFPSIRTLYERKKYPEDLAGIV